LRHQKATWTPIQCQPFFSASISPLSIPVNIMTVGIVCSQFVQDRLRQIYYGLRIRGLCSDSEPTTLFVLINLEQDCVSVFFNQAYQTARKAHQVALLGAATGHDSPVTIHAIADFGSNRTFSNRFDMKIAENEAAADVDWLPILCSSVSDFLAGREVIRYSFVECIRSSAIPVPPPPLPTEPMFRLSAESVPLPDSPNGK
jgi:hypothetical protein